MSFYFDGEDVTLNNYRSIFRGYSADIKDEVRSAVLDDTEIGVYIDKCKHDSYKLGQLRLCLRECIPLDYIDWKLSGRTLYNIRQGIALGINMKPIMDYCGVTGTKLGVDAIETLSDYVLVGVDITKIDFTKVDTALIPSLCKGLKNNYPMWLLQDLDTTLSETYIACIIKCMKLGIDIHPFLSGSWDTVIIDKILYLKNQDRIHYFLSLVNAEFSRDMVDTLIDLMLSGVSLDRLCVKDSSGRPVYNEYQMYEIGLAIRDECITEDMYNPSLADYKIKELRERQKIRNEKKINIKLPKFTK